MKRFIVFLITLCVCLTVSSQARLGSTLKELKTEFSAYDTKYIITEGIPSLSVIYMNVEVLYYFDKKGVCYQTSIVADNFTLVNNIINIYNKQYIITSRVSWIMIDSFRTVHIHLYHLAGVGYVFTWK